MRSLKRFLPILLFLYPLCLEAQKQVSNLKDIFAEEEVIHVTITTDIRNLLAEKKA